MEKNNIIEGSKLIAEYLGWKYIPFNDLQGFPKAGWFTAAPKGLPIVSPKQGYPIKVEGSFYRSVCRNHSDLRFYNSMDVLIPVIKKLEAEEIDFILNNGGCCSRTSFYQGEEISWNYKEDLTWVQNTFLSVVETIKYINKRKNG